MEGSKFLRDVYTYQTARRHIPEDNNLEEKIDIRNTTGPYFIILATSNWRQGELLGQNKLAPFRVTCQESLTYICDSVVTQKCVMRSDTGSI
jgi:hypothetical protein